MFCFCVLLFFLAVMENHDKLILMKSSVISFIYRAPSPDFEFSHSDLQKMTQYQVKAALKSVTRPH